MGLTYTKQKIVMRDFFNTFHFILLSNTQDVLIIVNKICFMIDSKEGENILGNSF